MTINLKNTNFCLVCLFCPKVVSAIIKNSKNMETEEALTITLSANDRPYPEAQTRSRTAKPL